MAEVFSAANVALSLMKEALTLLEEPEAMRAAQLLRQAIEATADLIAEGTDHSRPEHENGL